MQTKFVLLTAAKNESEYIRYTLNSIVVQTILPARWVIVSDRSSDGTDDIVAEYEKKYEFIKLIRLEGEARRNFGSQVHAINIGYETLKGEEYDFIGNVDADISFADDYFERLIGKFAMRPCLGLAGGTIYEERHQRFQYRPGNSERSVPHAVQFFRRECFEDVGGYLPLRYGGPDWCAELISRMKGWAVESYADLIAYHHKPTLSGEGRLRGAFRQGKMDYSLGSHLLFEAVKCLRRISRPPVFAYALARFIGFFSSFCEQEEKQVDNDVIRFLRSEQIGRLRSFLFTGCKQDSWPFETDNYRAGRKVPSFFQSNYHC